MPARDTEAAHRLNFNMHRTESDVDTENLSVQETDMWPNKLFITACTGWRIKSWSEEAVRFWRLREGKNLILASWDGMAGLLAWTTSTADNTADKSYTKIGLWPDRYLSAEKSTSTRDLTFPIRHKSRYFVAVDLHREHWSIRNSFNFV